MDNNVGISTQDLQSILKVSRALATEKNFEVLISLILNEVSKIVCADGGSIYVVETIEKKKYLRFKRSLLHINTDEFLLSMDHNSIAGYCASNAEPLLIKDVYNLPSNLPFFFNSEIDKKYNYHTKSMLVLPMVNQLGEVMGVLQLINRKSNFEEKLNIQDMTEKSVLPFTRRDYHLASLVASQSAIALYNQKLLEEQKELLESFILLIDGAIDSKSKYTGGHCHRVPIITKMLCEAACETNEGIFHDFNLAEEEWYELRIAAGLHDCGKIITPTHVMDKSTKLEAITDRIEIVKLRFELLRKEAKENISDEIKYKERLKKIDEMEEFISSSNIGGEFLGNEEIQKIKEISMEKFSYKGKLYSLLTENEVYNLSVSRGTLTREERLIINGHMVDTVKMLETLPFPPNLQRVPEYACGHHEKMDGSGYPRGIYAGDMSIPARIMAVADIFEALTANDRPYKKVMKLSKTMQIMGIMKKNNHFDPEVLDLFIRSKTYLKYAKKYLREDQIDEVDEKALLEIKPNTFELPAEEERRKRWQSFLPEYQELSKK